MSTSTLALEQKRAHSNPNMGWLWQHTTVKPTADDEHLQANQTNNLGHDLSQVSTQTTPCPATPTRCPFGGACHACPVHIQAKLKISQPDDEYEREADRIADMVMRMPEPMKDKNEQCGKLGCNQVLQRQATRVALPPVEVPPIVHEVLGSPGQPLDVSTRASMEPCLGNDLSQVRIHTGKKAAESAKMINAIAYTVGHSIVFGEGKYSPNAHEGKNLLVHELVHVIRQNKYNTSARLQRRTTRDDYATVAFETGPIWDVTLVILNAPDTDTEDFETFRYAAMDGIHDAVYSFGKDAQKNTREFNVQIKYIPKCDEFKVSQKAKVLARQAVLGSSSPTQMSRSQAPKRPVTKKTKLEQKLPKKIKQPINKENVYLCDRGFEYIVGPIRVPQSVARHCFVAQSIQGQRQSGEPLIGDTATFDNKRSGDPDLHPNMPGRVCRGKYSISFDCVKQKYKELCRPNEWEISSFNCCSCAYLALTACGAKLSKSDFPPENQGIGLPDSFGKTGKKAFVEISPWSDNKVREWVKNHTKIELQSLPISFKVHMINALLDGWITDSDIDTIEVICKNVTNSSDAKEIRASVEGRLSEMISIGQRTRVRFILSDMPR